MPNSNSIKSQTKSLFESPAVFNSVRKICNRVFFLPFFFKHSKQIQNTFDSRLQNNLQKNILSNIDLEHIEFKLNSFLLNKGYKDEELRKADFVAFLWLSTHPAHHFLNFKRLEEPKELIYSTKLPHNLLDIVFECGFNSLATFYRSCNEFYNCSPKKLHKFLLDNSSVLRKKTIHKTRKLKLISLLLLRPVLRSILKVERSLLTQLSIIIIHLFPRYSLCLFNAK
ncbi:DNA-binding helix-turn-helix protein [Leptospira alstonii serovar Pingchang str. 80-412]|uniref:DNA-binding helix-turn-helix protein n=2 Tax=Leptospira alstonii TaxID=28452 RepID=M6CLU5_9LEPT|nr:DNA-binding helix-turn-helix protein [Leptospira alstonii serovar Sichuan str. 79601]EQA81557.1 DNA-binding helix-turn-helix protein [Leptospira alstonii serovar Pingchang str. 80-412]